MNGQLMKTRLYLMLAFSAVFCWGCASSKHAQKPEPSFVMENFLPPAIIDLGPKTRPYDKSVLPPSNSSAETSDRVPPKDSIHFGFNQFSIPAKELGALQAHGDYLLHSPHLMATIEGHTDENGGDEYNFILGRKRAQTVKDRLIKMGVEDDRLEVKSFGKSQPLNPAHNKEAWQENRRVEFRYLDKNSKSKD